MGQIVVDVTAGPEDGRDALEAACIASLELDVELALVGPERRIVRALRGLAHDAEQLRIVDASPVADPSDDPASPGDAVAVGVALCADLPESAFVSAAPGARVRRAAQRILPPLAPGTRGAVAAVYPTLRHRGRLDDPFALLLDVGGTTGTSANDLVDWAAIGAAYASRISDNDAPTVGILADPDRIDDAPDSIRYAHKRLSERPGPLHYAGLIRADQITLGEADVLVCDGFTGQVVIQTLEGVFQTAEALLRHAGERFRWRIGVSMLGPGIERLRELTNWENYGGAPLLGYDRPVILAGQRAGQRAIFNSIRLAAKMIRIDVHGTLREQLRITRADGDG